MGDRPPGPLCSSRVGAGWIDGGTSCRTRSSPPGPTDIVNMWMHPNADKEKFDKAHTYSLSREAARKRDIDLQIIGDDYGRSGEVNIRNENYLKELIRIGSNGKKTVSTGAKKIQFFIVRGGGEGFLHSSWATDDAGRFRQSSQSTGGRLSKTIWDYNDLLVAFDPKGKLIRASFLQRPVAIAGRWSEENSRKTYNAWDNRAVSIYRNTHFKVKYLGLVVDDGKQHGWVDMHKEEQTNGCIFIVDNNTPSLNEKEKLNDFEPQLIHDVLAAIGKKPEDVKSMIHLGIMKVVDIK